MDNHWIEKEVWNQESENKTKRDLPECTFVEYDKYGETKRCYFKPSPAVCSLCILGELVGVLGYLQMDLEEIRKVVEKNV